MLFICYFLKKKLRRLGVFKKFKAAFSFFSSTLIITFQLEMLSVTTFFYPSIWMPLLPLVSVQGINYSWHIAKCFLSQSQRDTFRSFLKRKYAGQISYQFHDDVVINWPSPSLRKLQLLCGCGRRSRLWWGQPRRSSPGRLRRTQGWRCRKCGRRRSSPSSLTGSLLPLCCPQNPGHRRNLHRLQRCSEWKDEGV